MNLTKDVKDMFLENFKMLKKEIEEDTNEWNDILDQMDLIAIFRASHPKAGEYTYKAGE